MTATLAKDSFVGIDIALDSAAPLVLPATHVVRVIGGRLAGKDYPLRGGERLCIGHGLANDIVLRGAGTRGSVVELCRDGDTAMLRVVEGRVELLGRCLEAGEEAQLPGYLPFRIGEFVLAHGARDSARWDEAGRVAASRAAAPVEPLPAPGLADRLARIGRERWRDMEVQVRGPRLALAAASGLLIVAAAALLQADFAASRQEPASFEDQLAKAGIDGLAVAKSGTGGLVVSGVVAGEGEMERLRLLAADAAVPVTLDVDTSAGLASAASEILQAQGVDAAVEAIPAAPHALSVAAAFMPANRQAELTQVLKRDLPGLQRVTYRVDDARGGNALQAFFGAGATGMATLVPDPGYIVTADGARWFPGAVLPTGHTLVSIGKDSVRFEKDGRTEDLML